MEYAFEAYTALSGKLQLQPEMGLDALSGTLDRFWDEMLLDIVPLVSDIHVRSAYQILIRQAKAQAQAFTWLEQPEVFQSFAPGSVQKPRKPWLGLAAILILAGLTVWFLLPISGKNPVAAGCAAPRHSWWRCSISWFCLMPRLPELTLLPFRPERSSVSHRAECRAVCSRPRGR